MASAPGHPMTASSKPVPASRLESWGFVLAILALLGFAGAFGFALMPKNQTPSAAADDGPGNPSARYAAEEAVLAWHDGRWYRARVHSVTDERYFITYDDFSTSWNEWVTARRLRRR